MTLSAFIHSYVDFRLSNANLVELYIIDQIQEKQFEIIIKDSGKSLEGKDLILAKAKIESLKLISPNKYYQYFHKGQNNLQIELNNTKVKLVPNDLNSTIAFNMLQFPDKEFIFTYLSPKGEYQLNSKDFLRRFTKEEIQLKEFALYLNELLQDQLDEVIYNI